MRVMRLLTVLLLALLACPRLATAQTAEVDWDALAAAAQNWAEENLDEDVLQLLAGSEGENARHFFAEIQRELAGEYVLDLAALNDTARAVLPLLESYEETLPYALWLRSRLDYLEVAKALKLKEAPPKTMPGQPPRPVPNPKPAVQRGIWVEKINTRPWPKAAKAYVDRLKPVFTASRVPPELVWIAEVESSFDPRARSPAGAAGLFQLMPATARRFGLSLWPFDQRLKPEPAAKAAASYLQFLHGKFEDWRLALAAYNAGEGTVQNLLRRHKATSFDAIATRLPAETQMYVPRVEAVLKKREGLNLSQLRIPAATSPKP